MKHKVIGGGGIGSRVVEQLVRLVDPATVTVIDGDTLETKNLDRQLFNQSAVGRNKAEALAEKYGTGFIPEYYSCGAFNGMDNTTLLWCCADNNTCRREVLDECDLNRCWAILAGNEYTDAEAMLYERGLRNGPHDPRTIYPAILTDHQNDPLGPPGCVELSEDSPQLVLANVWAASFALHLYWFHFREHQAVDKRASQRCTGEHAVLAMEKAYWPIHHKVNFLQFSTIRRLHRQEVINA